MRAVAKALHAFNTSRDAHERVRLRSFIEMLGYRLVYDGDRVCWYAVGAGNYPASLWWDKEGMLVAL